jgi:hypothetical protein
MQNGVQRLYRFYILCQSGGLAGCSPDCREGHRKWRSCFCGNRSATEGSACGAEQKPSGTTVPKQKPEMLPKTRKNVLKKSVKIGLTLTLKYRNYILISVSTPRTSLSRSLRSLLLWFLLLLCL